MFQNITGLLKRHRADGSHVWHIDKRVRRYGRLCESTGTSDRGYLLHRLRKTSRDESLRRTAATYLSKCYSEIPGRELGEEVGRSRCGDPRGLGYVHRQLTA